ncbi:hypothetical protein ALI144C_27550 [Actinosynnema sp. ALI-1.44]|nr:hypothetical protein ALI144C_27550 [Actinosynnema sp. ALI-1.44]
MNQLMDRYLELPDVDVTTRKSYESHIRNHIRPMLGHLQVGKLNGETFDSFYAVLRTCRARWGGRTFIEHRSRKPHECTDNASAVHNQLGRGRECQSTERMPRRADVLRPVRAGQGVRHFRSRPLVRQ